MNHIGFGHLGLDGHGVEVGELEDYRRQLVGDHRLPFLGDDTHHMAIDRRDDAGVAEVDPRRIDLHLGALDLRVQRAQVGLLHLEFGLGVLEVLARDRLVGLEHVVAFVDPLGLLELGLHRAPLGLQLLGVDLGLAQRVARHQRVDFGQPLAFGDLVAKLDLERLELPRNLGTDVDLANTFQGAGSQHRVFDIATLDRGGDVLRRLGWGLYRVEHDAGDQGHGDTEGDLAKLRLFHETVLPEADEVPWERACPAITPLQGDAIALQARSHDGVTASPCCDTGPARHATTPPG